MNKVNCMQCPCLNNDADYGQSCNLGYKIKDGLFYAYSNECQLIKVVYAEKDTKKLEEFTPEKES